MFLIMFNRAYVTIRPSFKVASLERLAPFRAETLGRLCSRRPSTALTAASRIVGQGKSHRRSDAPHRGDMMGVEDVTGVAAPGR